MIHLITLLTSQLVKRKIEVTEIKQYEGTPAPLAGDYILLNKNEYFLVERRVLSPDSTNVICLGRVIWAKDGLLES